MFIYIYIYTSNNKKYTSYKLNLLYNFGSNHSKRNRLVEIEAIPRILRIVQVCSTTCRRYGPWYSQLV